jgi:hypothetical protein
MWLDHSKDVCACFNLHHLQLQCINASCVEVMALIRCVFLHLVTKMSDWFLEQWITIKFCVKLGKNAQDTYALLRLMGEKLWRSQVFLNGINGSKTGTRTCKMMKKMLITFVSLDSPPWQWSSSQDALSQAVSGPKIDYWAGITALFPWFGSKWLLALSKNKVYLKGTQDIENIQKKVWMAVKAFPQ